MHKLCIGERPDRPGTILLELVASGGKRLRAHLALATVEALGGDRSKAIGWAAACELLHNASLLHDDLQDGDRMRRGVEAAWVTHGMDAAITAGDLGLMLPYEAIDHIPVSAETKWHLTKALSLHANKTARGQADEASLLPDRRVSWASYWDAAVGKTAALFALPVEGAALIAGRTPAEARALAAAIAPVGGLFQVQDDVLDLYGDKGRDDWGSDLREGRVTALVVEHLRLHPDERAELLAVLDAPRRGTPDAAVRSFAERFVQGGALESIWDRLGEVEELVENSLVLAREPVLRAVAVELIARAIVPIAHTSESRRVWAMS
jgi:geranylgeranyl diphosphate synthase type I